MAALISVLLTAYLLTLMGCAANPSANTGSVVEQLGVMPIPTAQTLSPPATAPGHPQIAAIGTIFTVTLPGTGNGMVTALGPQIDQPPPATQLPIEQAHATITVRATATSGSIPLRATDFTVRDDRDEDIRIEPVGPSTLSAKPSRPQELALQGTFHSGAAQMTWRYHNTVVAIWDFNVELD